MKLRKGKVVWIVVQRGSGWHPLQVIVTDIEELNPPLYNNQASKFRVEVSDEFKRRHFVFSRYVYKDRDTAGKMADHTNWRRKLGDWD